MNIAVYCGSKSGTNQEYSLAALKLGEWIAKNGHTLVYGGSSIGIMGIVSKAVLANNGKVIGVFPKNLMKKEPLANLDNLILVETIDQRKEKMIELADSFIALPGGPGTLEEISQTISLARVEQLSGYNILYNIDGYYDSLINLFDKMLEEKFITEEERAIVNVISSLDDLETLLKKNNY